MRHTSREPFCRSKDKVAEYIEDRFSKLEAIVRSKPDPYVREQQLRNLRKTKKTMSGRIDVFKKINC